MMNRIRSIMTGALLMLSLAFALLPGTVKGAQSLQPMTLTVLAGYEGSALEGVAYRLYKVAEPGSSGGYSATEAFRGCSAELTADAENAKTLADYVLLHQLPADAAGRTDAAGQLVFPAAGQSLLPGLYLLVSDPYIRDGASYEESPVLVALPNEDTVTGTRTNDVTVYAKTMLHIERAPAVPTMNHSSETPVKTVPADTGKTLPQTGLLWWPVPILFLFGMVCILLGSLTDRRRKRGN